MPTRDSDPGCNSKKMHIGNDFVTIVYNDSQQAVKFGRIKVRYPFAPKYKKTQVWRTGSREPSISRFLFFSFLFFSFLFFSFLFFPFFFPIKFPGICTIYYVLSFSFRRQGQFNFAEVLIKPLDNASNMVTVRFKDELKELLSDTGTRVISDNNLPRLVRQLVVHINVSII